MNELKAELRSMIARLEENPATEDGLEAGALFHLVRLAAAIDSPPDRRTRTVAELRKFWLGSVPWCSPLSKDLEKILILYDEVSDMSA